MDETDIVQILTEMLADNGRTFELQYGSQALANVQEMASVIQIRLQDETAHVRLWEEFMADPIDKGPELEGVLEMLFEADGNLAAQVDGYLEEFNRLIAGESEGAALRGARTGDDEELGAPDRSNVPIADSTEQREDINIGREGTYLYGNWDTATPQVGGGVGHGEGEPSVYDESAADRPPPQTVRANVMSQTFEELYSLIETHPDLDEDAKRDLQAELQEIQRLLIRTHRRAREAGRD
jgi:hypothetical protein